MASNRTLFIKYVSQNILGALGMSAYFLADTLFISIAAGADGITALNLVLPVYSIIYAIGAMIGTGSAIRFQILSARKDPKAQEYFPNSVMWACLTGLFFTAAGIAVPGKIVAFMGGDETIVAVGTSYTRFFMAFSPFFMLNHIFNAFIRNDGAPSLAMAATLGSSLFNIVMDYVLVFPMKMGMAGAALATGFSPILGIAVCSLHFLSEKNTIRFRLRIPSAKLLISTCQLGISAFVGEISSGVTTALFNFLILGLAGNTGVAAYGIVANISLVATAIFNGVAQGSQPLFSACYGRNDQAALKDLLKFSIAATVVLAAAVIAVIYRFAEPIAALFNSENSYLLKEYAISGMKLYFIGFLFAGFNIVGTGFLSATEKAASAFAASISRGLAAIVVMALLLAWLMGMTGVWLAFPAAEAVTTVITGAGLRTVCLRSSDGHNGRKTP